METALMEKLNIKLHRIPLPFRLNHVNTWLIEEDDGLTVIDTGLNHPYSEEAWVNVLSKQRIKRIIITHYHPDHYGFAGTPTSVNGGKRVDEPSR